MFTEIEYDYKQDDNFDEMITKSLNVLCSDSMTILQNNTKVLKYLTDTKLKQEMSMLVKSLGMAIKHARFKLVQSIILGLKDNVHKLAALEIEYFDENEQDIYIEIFYNLFLYYSMNYELKKVNELFKDKKSNKYFQKILYSLQVYFRRITLANSFVDEMIQNGFEMNYDKFIITLNYLKSLENIQIQKYLN